MQLISASIQLKKSQLSRFIKNSPNYPWLINSQLHSFNSSFQFHLVLAFMDLGIIGDDQV